MKALALITTIGMMVFTTTTASAQDDRRGSFSVHAGTTVASIDGDAPFNGSGYTVGVGYNVTENIAVGASYTNREGKDKCAANSSQKCDTDMQDIRVGVQYTKRMQSIDVYGGVEAGQYRLKGGRIATSDEEEGIVGGLKVGVAKEFYIGGGDTTLMVALETSYQRLLSGDMYADEDADSLGVGVKVGTRF